MPRLSPKRIASLVFCLLRYFHKNNSKNGVIKSDKTGFETQRVEIWKRGEKAYKIIAVAVIKKLLKSFCVKYPQTGKVKKSNINKKYPVK